MIRRLSTLALVVIAGVLASAPVSAPARAAEGLELTARVAGHDVDGDRFALRPQRDVRVSLTLNNRSDARLRIRTVRLYGTALGLTFFSYDTSVEYDLRPGERTRQSFTLDLSDLDSQVTGLFPVAVAALDDDRETLAEAETVVDVRGSLLSVYGVFGLVVLAMTALSWTAALLALARHRLPANRWLRALRFLPAGVGTGLVAVVTLSVLRVIAPQPVSEVPLVVAVAAATFILGYLTPSPDEPDERSRPPAPGNEPTRGVGSRHDQAVGGPPPRLAATTVEHAPEFDRTTVEHGPGFGAEVADRGPHPDEPPPLPSRVRAPHRPVT